MSEWQQDDGCHDECVLACPGHGLDFDIRTGKSSLKRYRLAMFQVYEKDGSIFLGNAPLSTADETFERAGLVRALSSGCEKYIDTECDLYQTMKSSNPESIGQVRPHEARRDRGIIL